MRIIAECIFVLFEINKGLNILSIQEEVIPKKKIPHAAKSFPAINIKIKTGIHIIAVPIIGKIPATTAKRVRKRALGTLKMKNPIPAIIPWSIPIMTVP